MIDFFNSQVDDFGAYCIDSKVVRPREHVDGFIELNPKKISWSRSLQGYLANSEKIQFDSSRMVRCMYRPFAKQIVYFDSHANHERSQLPRVFPTSEHANFGFYVTGVGAAMKFTALAAGNIPDLSEFGGQTNGQFFPRYTYRELAVEGGFDFGESGGGGYERVDNITDSALVDYRKTCTDPTITKDDIFYYTYGLLHSLEYCELFKADLKKPLSRIPRVRDFHSFTEAGRKLADLHINYEQAEPYKGLVETPTGEISATPPSELYRVAKMKIPKTKGQPDRSTIIYSKPDGVGVRVAEQLIKCIGEGLGAAPDLALAHNDIAVFDTDEPTGVHSHK
ncbi:type ISP restriction/modification enzyme [Streptomyces sp. ME19-01-6]|uniref:type ISP restriction/modification enzyme n=1 Tax=Streptomyces sp. ME19-01-6 TaxID=3028686 RepID=UPI0029B718B3|nr:type ISP restriction/modification enzyme [Streptomyces sp. ME19-01-6]MDX3231345.1 hypothetical protein [Streptomyces sp. ME19-01-6]